MTWKKLREVEWEVIRKLYCEEGYSAPDIVKILKNKGISVNKNTIYYKVKTKGWICNTKNEKILRPEDAEKLTENLTEGNSFNTEIINPIQDSKERMIAIIEDLNDIVTKSLALKKNLLERTQKRLNDGAIDELKASRILSNLGLSMFNIAKVLGIKMDEGLINPEQQKDVTPQIQIYLPNNGRDQKEKEKYEPTTRDC